MFIHATSFQFSAHINPPKKQFNHEITTLLLAIGRWPSAIFHLYYLVVKRYVDHKKFNAAIPELLLPGGLDIPLNSNFHFIKLTSLSMRALLSF